MGGDVSDLQNTQKNKQAASSEWLLSRRFPITPKQT